MFYRVFRRAAIIEKEVISAPQRGHFLPNIILIRAAFDIETGRPHIRVKNQFAGDLVAVRGQLEAGMPRRQRPRFLAKCLPAEKFVRPVFADRQERRVNMGKQQRENDDGIAPMNFPENARPAFRPQDALIKCERQQNAGRVGETRPIRLHFLLQRRAEKKEQRHARKTGEEFFFHRRFFPTQRDRDQRGGEHHE